MAVEGITNLVQGFADQVLRQEQNGQAAANAPAAGDLNNPAVTEDTFTSSVQNNAAQAVEPAAGVFQLSQGALSAFTAGNLFAPQASGAAGNDAIAGPPASPATREPAAQSAEAAVGRQEPASKAVPATNTQQQIQALNAELPTLGLTAAEIEQIDRLASVIQNFNPAAYADLVKQFELQGQQAPQPNVTNPAPNTGSSNDSSANGISKTNG